MPCDSCKAEIVEILEHRIKKILELSKQSDLDEGLGQSHCFHLMEVQRKIEGKSTCGVYD